MYDYNGKELGKFRDISYAYTGAFSPDGTLFYNIEKTVDSTRTQLKLGKNRIYRKKPGVVGFEEI